MAKKNQMHLHQSAMMASQSQKEQQPNQESNKSRKTYQIKKKINQWCNRMSSSFHKYKDPVSNSLNFKQKRKSSGGSSQLQHIDDGVGLPNIGNTCYLNSVIQFLYAAQEYRSYLILFTKKRQTVGVARCLGELFFMMENKKSNVYKAQSIQQMLQELQKNKLKQDDAFKTINTMLNKVDQGMLNQQSLSDMFKAQYTQSCNCFSEEYQVQTMYLTSRPEVCGRCKGQIKKYFRKKPEYLIITEKCIQTPEDVVYLLEKKGNKSIPQPYHLIAQMIYIGSGFQGHYICVRSKGKHKTLYNDSQVLSLDTKDGQEAMAYFTKYGRSLILLYQSRFSPYNQYNSNQSEYFQKEEKNEYLKK